MASLGPLYGIRDLMLPPHVILDVNHVTDHDTALTLTLPYLTSYFPHSSLRNAGRSRRSATDPTYSRS